MKLILVLLVVGLTVLVTQFKQADAVHMGHSEALTQVQTVQAKEKPVQPIKKEIKKKVVKNTAPKPKVVQKPVIEPTIESDWIAQCKEWAAQAGVVLDEHAIELIDKESKCNPVAQNPTSAAGGIPQALPYSKTGCEWGDPVCQLRWMNQYIADRYGSWAAALQFHRANNYY